MFHKYYADVNKILSGFRIFDRLTISRIIAETKRQADELQLSACRNGSDII